eukprot:962084-Pleurochrysis_carterae.AAC.1
MSLSSLKSSTSLVRLCRTPRLALQSALSSAAGGHAVRAAIHRHASTQPSTDRSLALYRSNHGRSTVICRSTTNHHATNRLYIRTA